MSIIQKLSASYSASASALSASSGASRIERSLLASDLTSSALTGYWEKRRLSRAASPSSAFSARATGRVTQSAIRPKQTAKGALTQSDAYRSGLASYVDEYQLKGIKAGQVTQISLKSRALDGHLQLINARTRRTLLYGEDSSTDNSDARLVFTAKAGVKYLVRISTSQKSSSDFRAASRTGSYRLQVRSLPTDSDFNFFYGSGLVNASAAVAQALGASPFADVADLGGDRWRLDQINAPEVWAQGYSGQGVTVAVLDGGVDYLHPDLQKNIWTNSGEIAGNGIDDDRNGFIDDTRGWNFIDNTNDPINSPLDGHGTHIAGAIAANGQITGVAYSAKIMPIKVINSGTTSDTTVAQGIRYAVQNGARVINISLGKEPGAGISSDFEEALQFAHQAGAVVVLAAGNRRQTLGALQPDNPAAYAASNRIGIAIGATDKTGTLSLSSNPAGRRSHFLVAPGVSIRSTTPNGEYASYTGTSMAAPHVAGVAALLLSANPNLTAAQVQDLLITTANRQGASLSP